MKRQNAIFERAVKKFKSDVGLWVEYIEHAKRQSAPTLVGRVTARYETSRLLNQTDEASA